LRFEKELESIRRISEQAGRLALENRARGFEWESKPDHSPVTSADKANERLICKLLEAAYPEDGILGEEGAARESRSGRRWIIDPIDGTRDFVRGIPTWSVLLALEADGEVVAGACNQAALGELYSAANGLGAFCNGVSIHVGPAKSRGEAILCLTALKNLAGHEFSDRLIPWMAGFWTVRSMGGCMDAMLVASGRADAFIEVQAKAWDLAALKIITEEAGAHFFNLNGNSSIYAGNAVITIPSLEAEIREFLNVP
jgi:histidinol phosphatase-like enzyme (inositol monophosphatase family)